MYNIVIQYFIDYTPFEVTVKIFGYIPCAVHYILVAYLFVHSSLYQGIFFFNWRNRQSRSPDLSNAAHYFMPSCLCTFSVLCLNASSLLPWGGAPIHPAKPSTNATSLVKLFLMVSPMIITKIITNCHLLSNWAFAMYRALYIPSLFHRPGIP